MTLSERKIDWMELWREAIVLLLVLLPFILLIRNDCFLDVQDWVVFSGYVLLGWLALILDIMPDFFNKTF